MAKMKQYKVTLNFTFEPHSFDEGYEEGKELKKKEKAFARTEKYFAKYSVIDHIKKNDAFAFVEYICSDGEVISAQWHPKEFKITMVVDTDQSKEELIEDLRMNSLEDGEYEACGDTGWIVMTRGPKGEEFGAPWDMSDTWEYGLTDYRSNPIEAELIGEKPNVPECDQLFSLTDKGKELYEKLSEARKKGIQLNEEDDKKFWMMRNLMADKKLYGVT